MEWSAIDASRELAIGLARFLECLVGHDENEGVQTVLV